MNSYTMEGDLVRKLAAQRGVSMTALAASLGMSRQSLYAVLAGQWGCHCRESPVHPDAPAVAALHKWIQEEACTSRW